MSGRTWVAVLLCFLVWFVWERYFLPPPPVSSPQSQTPQVEAPKPTVTPPESRTFFMQESPMSATIDLPEALVEFSALGGRPTAVRLKKYRQTIDPTSPPIATFEESVSGGTLNAYFTEPLLEKFSSTVYEQNLNSPQISFQGQRDGIVVSKTWNADSASHAYKGHIKIVVPPQKKDWGFLLIPIGAKALIFDQNDPLKSWEAVTFQNEKVIRSTSDAIAAGETVHQGTTSWAAFGNRYFSTAIINESEINPDVVFTKTNDFTGVVLKFPIVLKTGQREIDYKFTVYSGPKDYVELAKYKGLKSLIDYGMFSFVAYPLLAVLNFFYGLIPNYGIAIILLTIAVRLLFYPLSVKSAQSMKAMQKLQPQLQALREKYKEDMARFNQEQMAMFKAHKVNPMGGCLPMLVQLPVFIALYAVLSNSIELFHAPFFGWIQDLSTKDQFYVFPVLMGISMFIQQKMTPTAGMDPMQAKMLLAMPIIFTFVMLNLPSGLTIYIFLSTLLGIIQQWLMNRDREVTPALASVRK